MAVLRIELDDGLYRQVRAALALRDDTFRQLCMRLGVHATNGRKALIGAWTGPGASVVRRKILKAVGLRDVQSPEQAKRGRRNGEAA